MLYIFTYHIQDVGTEIQNLGNIEHLMCAYVTQFAIY